jgi:hypothetical protein
MDVEPESVADLPEVVQDDVEAVADWVSAWLDEGVSADELSPLDAGKRDSHALTRFRTFDGPIVHLGAPHSHLDAARLR